MSEHQQLLDEARRFCDPTTGEVIERIPDELMDRLRAAKLARGIHGKRSQRTASDATWFVFLSEEIRDRVLTDLRKKRATRKHAVGKEKRMGNSSSIDVAPKVARGLKAFRKRKNPTDE